MAATIIATARFNDPDHKDEFIAARNTVEKAAKAIIRDMKAFFRDLVSGWAIDSCDQPTAEEYEAIYSAIVAERVLGFISDGATPISGITLARRQTFNNILNTTYSIQAPKAV